jgi:hypothetical protein
MLPNLQLIHTTPRVASVTVTLKISINTVDILMGTKCAPLLT